MVSRGCLLRAHYFNNKFNKLTTSYLENRGKDTQNSSQLFYLVLPSPVPFIFVYGIWEVEMS